MSVDIHVPRQIILQGHFLDGGQEVHACLMEALEDRLGGFQHNGLGFDLSILRSTTLALEPMDKALTNKAAQPVSAC